MVLWAKTLGRRDRDCNSDSGGRRTVGKHGRPSEGKRKRRATGFRIASSSCLARNSALAL
ncbi:hypothetical protein CC80DRAFT_493327 [Byssothecium circinans]|uniref:Uncharacterized protein n=1 Tax=Byssothecium circinans TaxID=147558 RepID=A0A6A5TRM9_9PLEO|nr:hypothetical protein CC80DRAFT_493327 [Byssothecium circinans]